MKLTEATARIETSVREASAIVNDAKKQAELQSERHDQRRKKRGLGDHRQSRHRYWTVLRTTMMEGMRDDVADLAVSIASRVIKQTIDEKKQRELVDQFIGEEMKGKE